MDESPPAAAQHLGAGRSRPLRATGLREQAAFFRGFVRSPAQVGSVIPSSERLQQRLVQAASVAEARCVVELGPGTGGTTAALLDAMSPHARLLAIELDAAFHEYLSHGLYDPRLVLQRGSAEALAEHLAAHGLPAPDVVVSGIPFSTMPPEVSARIAAGIAQVLAPGGRFVAYQVRAHVADFMHPHLGPPRTEWEIVNVPPVRVFRWEKR